MEINELREMVGYAGTWTITYHDSDYEPRVETFDSYLAACARQDELIAQYEEELG